MPTLRRARGGGVAAAPAALLVAALAASCGSGTGREVRADGSPTVRPVPAGAVLDLDFEQSYVAPGAVVASAQNSGSGEIRSTVTTSAGGRITRERGFDSSSALRFPAYDADVTSAAVLLVWQKETDRLSPGDKDFLFGADFALDEVSAGSPADNGDNLLQRGLAEDPTQYKLQIDKGVPSCRIAGTGGEAVVKATKPVQPGEWYRVTCRRTADKVTLVVRRLDATGPDAREEVAVAAKPGTVAMASGIPVSVGGKVSSAGEITTSATDQFNGTVDNVRFELLD